MHPRPDTGCIYGNKKGQDHAAHFIIRYLEVFKTLLPQKLPQYSFQITAGRVCFFCLSFFCGRQLLFWLFLFILCVFVMAVRLSFCFLPFYGGFFVFNSQFVIGFFWLFFCSILFSPLCRRIFCFPYSTCHWYF